MARTFRVGIIGHTGRGDYGHSVDVAFTKLPNVEIVGVADPDPAGREKAVLRTGAKQGFAAYHEMLQATKPDIVAICPRWIDQHHDMLLAAAHAGCHVYMEKPFCRTAAECDSAIRELEMRHLKLGIAHISQYSPVLQTVLQVIAAGEIGEVLELRARGKEDRRGGGEDLWVLGSHVLGLMRSLAGAEVRSCQATVTMEGAPLTRQHVVEGNEGIGLLGGDHVQARYSFANGVTGYFASQRNRGGSPSRFAIQVFGSKGILEMESGYLVPAHILRDPAWSPGRSAKAWEKITSAGIGQAEPRTDGNYEGGHIAAIQDLMGAIEEDRSTRCSAEDARAITEMIAAVFEAHRLGTTVSLPLMTRVNPLSLLK